MGEKENLERIANALEEVVRIQKDVYENPQQFMERAREGLDALVEPRVIEAEATRREGESCQRGLKPSTRSSLLRRRRIK